jgi:hypothetical protein
LRACRAKPSLTFLRVEFGTGFFVAGDKRAEKGLNISAQRLEIGDCRAREMPVKAAFPFADLDAWVSAGFSSAMILNSSAVPLRPSPRWPGHRCSQPYSAGPPSLSCRVEFGTDQPALFEFGTGFLPPQALQTNFEIIVAVRATGFPD